MMARFPVFLVMASIVFAALPSIAAERYRLRSPMSKLAGIVNEVPVWKTVNAAKKAGGSLADGFVFDKSIACVVEPGRKATVLKREGSVAFVRASNAMFGGCRGYVKTEFLSVD